MMCLRAIGWYCLLALPLWAAPGTAVFKTENLHIEAHLNHETLYHGYTAHRFTIHHSGTGKRTIKFTLPSFSNSNDHTLKAVTRTFIITPGTRDVTILQPPLPFSWSDTVLVECNGHERVIERGLRRRLEGIQNTGWQQPRVVLLSRQVDYVELNNALGAVSMPSHFHGATLTGRDHAELEYSSEKTSAWPEKWLAYSGYDMIVLSGEEWQLASSATRTALHRWVSAGGKLVVLGEGYTASTGWPMDPAGTVQYMGFGQVNLFTSESDQSRDAIVTLLGTHDPDSNQNTIPMLGPLRRATERIHNDEIWYGSQDADFNSAFPVIGGARAPVRLVIGVLTLFVLVAGPINLFLLNRKGRRAWFLWTLPAISLVTSGLVFAVSFFSEGITPRVRTEAITILNQTEQDAVTLGTIGIYAPIAPSQLKFPGHSEVTPLLDPNARDTGSDRRAQWTEGGEQLLTGKWVSSRVPTHFSVRTSEHTEKRIVVTWTGGRPEILNSLGTAIKQLTLRGTSDDFFTATDILPGEKVTLNPSTAGIPKRSTINEFANTLLESSAEKEWEYLSIGLMPESTYWAVIDRGSPFLENPLADRKTKDTTLSHVIGVLPPEEMTP